MVVGFDCLLVGYCVDVVFVGVDYWFDCEDYFGF